MVDLKNKNIHEWRELSKYKLTVKNVFYNLNIYFFNFIKIILTLVHVCWHINKFMKVTLVNTAIFIGFIAVKSIGNMV